MRSSVLLSAAMILTTSLTAFAQVDSSRNYDFQKPMYTVVDVATKSMFSGWSGDCNSGRIPAALTLWRMDPATLQFTNVPVTISTGARPDAAAWMASACGRPFDPNVGWSLVPKDSQPDGQFVYVVLVSDVPTSWTCGAYPAGYPNAGELWCDYIANQVRRTVR